MRRWIALGGLATLALLAAAGPAPATTYVGLEDLTCDGVAVRGSGLPQQTQLDVALVDPASKRTLQRGTPTTSAAGAFTWRVHMSLSGRRAVRAVISQPGRSQPLAWAEQTLPSPCPLARTGPPRTLPLLGVASSSLALGVLLLLAFAYQGRHAVVGGRHLAPGGGRHQAPC
jgi:hypothetical protein